MATFDRQRGPGLYAEIFLPASARRTSLAETHRDRDHLPALRDPRPTSAQVARALDVRLAAPGCPDYTAAELVRIYDFGRCMRADLRSVMLAYLTLAATTPEGNS